MSNRKSKSGLLASNYCVCFIDLLGQKDAVKGQGLIPRISTPEDAETFNKVVRESILTIEALQDQANNILHGLRPKRKSAWKNSLSKEQHAIWDTLSHSKVKKQHWSDGLMAFSCLGDEQVRCHMNGIYSLFCMAGSLCFIGLGSRAPVRGAIEIAWGVEIKSGELYGPAVARAYELESTVAQFPRVVIGESAVNYLRLQAESTSKGMYADMDRNLARLCLDMIVVGPDKQPMLNYLGGAFRAAVAQDLHASMYSDAHSYVIEQLDTHRASGCAKLISRYEILLDYFNSFPPSEGA